MTSRKTGTILEIPVKHPFNFRLMLFSHGWVDLEPFHWDAEKRTLSTVLGTGQGRAFALTVTCRNEHLPGQCLCVTRDGGPRMSRRDLAAIGEKIRWMFRLDEDFSPFRRRCARTKGLRWVNRFGLGSFLRNGDLFEEFVKILFTTNVNWAGTKLMTAKLIEHLGKPVGGAGADGARHAFPGAAEIAGVSDAFLRDKVRVGYRAPYLLELAEAVASGSLCLEEFLDNNVPSGELAKKLAGLKGFGPYAVSALMQTLGRYDRLILDSWIRRVAAVRHFDHEKAGTFDHKKISDDAINGVYAKWGDWKALACWFECAYDTWFKDDLKEESKRAKV
jgi:3-methyladenine DNA glycosylase/8-oxoguanine DNA glycosylase